MTSRNLLIFRNYFPFQVVWKMWGKLRQIFVDVDNFLSPKKNKKNTTMKLIPADYMGSTAMDRRFSGPMLPWITSEIKKQRSRERVSNFFSQGERISLG